MKPLAIFVVVTNSSFKRVHSEITVARLTHLAHIFIMVYLAFMVYLTSKALGNYTRWG